MQLRLATPDDLVLLAAWDEKDHVKAATGPDDGYDWATELARTVPWREFLVGEVGGRPVGIVQIIDAREEETHYWGEAAPNLRAIDIWLGEEADLGRGYGSAMMRLALARCFAHPEVTAVLLDPLAANVRAHRFYERHGFAFVERRTFGSDDCFVYAIDRETWERLRS